jgi:hypothetical protein
MSPISNGAVVQAGCLYHTRTLCKRVRGPTYPNSVSLLEPLGQVGCGELTCVGTQYRLISTGRLTAQHRAVRACGSFGRRICARCESTSQHHDMMSHMSGVRTTSGFDGGAGVDSRGRDVAGDLATSAGVLTTRLIIVTCNGAVAFGALNWGKTVGHYYVSCRHSVTFECHCRCDLLSGLHGAWCTCSAWSMCRVLTFGIK